MPIDLELEATRSLNRLMPRVDALLRESILKKTFLERIEKHFPTLFHLYYQLYHEQYDFFYYLEELLLNVARYWQERPNDLKELDTEREANPDWFLSNQMLAGVCYVDRFAKNLAGVRQQVPFFKELGLTYLHLMPLFESPQPENDGGYAVSSYRKVDARLGSMAELKELAQELRQNGISLALDLVFNHTSDEHEWAKQALTANPDYQAYYHIFPDRQGPDAYERNLREIFPDEHPGAFTYRPEIKQWVWTTFHTYQWDLDYANPAVFNRMVEEMLFLANIGVEVLRLDAVAFIWKKLGTTCENLPEAHLLIRAFNAVARIAAPALLFKSEAIVHPNDVASYIAPEECQLSYNPLLMALLWNSLATRQVNLLQLALQERFKIAHHCAWVNYVRCHDDIGWTFSDEDAARLGINGYDHRKFLNEFYTGRFPGSFARGLPFQENPKTGDCRISGTCASLAGLEKASKEETSTEVELAIRRILLIHGIIMTIGGIPLIYLGDEIGSLNDYSYCLDPNKTADSRWVHRPKRNWKEEKQRKAPSTISGCIYREMQRLFTLRKKESAFTANKTEIIPLSNESVLGYIRCYDSESVIIFANFSEQPQTVAQNALRQYGLGYEFRNLLTGKNITHDNIQLEAYQFMCLKSV